MDFARRIAHHGYNVVKRIGDVAGHVVKRVGEFVSNHHPAIAAVSNVIAQYSGNPTLMKIADNVGKVSNAYSALQNYHKGTHINRDSSINPNVAMGHPVPKKSW